MGGRERPALGAGRGIAWAAQGRGPRVLSPWGCRRRSAEDDHRLADPKHIPVAQSHSSGETLSIDESAVPGKPVVASSPNPADAFELGVDRGYLGIPTDTNVGPVTSPNREIRLSWADRNDHLNASVVTKQKMWMASALSLNPGVDFSRRRVTECVRGHSAAPSSAYQPPRVPSTLAQSLQHDLSARATSRSNNRRLVEPRRISNDLSVPPPLTSPIWVAPTSVLVGTEAVRIRRSIADVQGLAAVRAGVSQICEVRCGRGRAKPVQKTTS